MKNNVSKILPVLFGFFVMGFCDVVGIANSYAKIDFGLSETVAGFIPSMVFIWFLLLSVPAAMLMNRLGRKKMVQLSNIITIVGMLLPFISYNLATCLLAFAFLGIGNTMLQVSLNPLLTNVVKGDALTSSLTAGQVVKAVSSICGPFIAAFAAGTLGNWKYLFPIFALVTLISAVWLMATHIEEQKSENNAASVGSVFGLLKDKTILFLFLGIFFVVGVDVGVNTLSPKLLMERAGWAVENAGLAASVYFFCKTAGAFIGAFALAKVNAVKYFRWNIGIAVLALLLLFFADGAVPMMILIGVVGLFCASVFSIVYAAAMQARPDKANEISGLMITGVSGGAVIPPLMGAMTDMMGCQVGSIVIIGICMLYLLWCSFRLSES